MKLSTPFFATLIWLFSSAAVAGESVAVQLTADNLDQYRVGGVDAIAGINDWTIGNGIVCGAVSDVSHDSGLRVQGGVLIDFGLCGKAHDQWAFKHFFPNMDQYYDYTVVSITAADTINGAELRVTINAGSLQIINNYRLADDADVLAVDYEITRLKEGGDATMMGILAMHVHRAITPFVYSTYAPEYSRGFNHIDFDSDDMISAVDAMVPADLVIFEGMPDFTPKVSYGLQLAEGVRIDADGSEVKLPQFAQSYDDYSIQGVFTDSPWLGGEGKLGLLEFAQSQLMDIAMGDKVIIRQKMWVSEQGDVAGITDQIFMGEQLTGKVDVPNARIMVYRMDGAPITTAVTDSSGNYSLRLPKGLTAVKLEVKTQWETLPAKVVALDGNDQTIQTLTTVKPSTIVVSSNAPVRLIVKGVNGTVDPLFNHDLIEFTLSEMLINTPHAVNYISLSGKEAAPEVFALPAGDYKVYASRGLEYEVVVQELSIKPGQAVNFMAPTLTQQIVTPGWLSADFHVHSAPSFDTSISVSKRLRSYVAQGGEVLIGTEHNSIYDYTNDIVAENLEEDIRIVAGTELTSLTRTETMPFSYGHANVFPMEYKADAYSGGITRHEGKRIRDNIAYYDADKEAVLMQMNHPRSMGATSDDSYYLDHLVNGQYYNPSLPLTSETNKSLIEPSPITGVRDIDIDLIEAWNGPNYANYQVIRHDWFSFLAQGEIIFASANSDSHGDSELVAMPRNYVYTNGELADFKQDEFISAVSKGKFFGSSGPIVNVAASNGEVTIEQAIGGSLAGSNITLTITARAANWVPVDALRVYVNGDVVVNQAISAGKVVEVPLQLKQDSFVVVEVEGEATELYQTIAPGYTPFAFTNPLFIDANNDGKWTAPNLQ